MPQLEKDIDITTNVGQALTHWKTLAYNQGALKGYENMPVGGPPGEDFDADVRELDTIDIETEIPGADAAARATFVAAYAQGTVFSCVASAADSGDMQITGVGRIGRDYYVSDASQTKNREGNSTMKITLREKGATAV